MLFLTASWCLLIIAAPLLSSQHRIFSSGMIYYFFSKLCHQIPERSFMLCDRQFAVCSRCTGIYSGFLFGVLIFPLITLFKNEFLLSRKLFLIMLIPLAADVFISVSGIWHNTFTSRYITGFLVGGFTALLLIPRIFNFHTKREET